MFELLRTSNPTTRNACAWAMIFGLNPSEWKPLRPALLGVIRRRPVHTGLSPRPIMVPFFSPVVHVYFETAACHCNWIKIVA